MTSLNRPVLIPLALGALVVLSACGADDESTGTDASTPTTDIALADVDEEAADEEAEDNEAAGVDADGDGVDSDDADEHGDEEHSDEQHDDHGDDDHGGDEDHSDGEGSGGLGAHEHGTAEMTVAWIDGEVAIDLISPTFNIFGFEYEPTSDEDLRPASKQAELELGPTRLG